MRRLALAMFALSALAVASCSSDDKGGSATTAAAGDDEAAPAGESADTTTADSAGVDTVPPDTTAVPDTTTVDVTGSDDSTSVPDDSTSVPDDSTVDSTDDSIPSTDVIDVIDDSIFDTIPDATDLPPVPTGTDVTSELCDTLVSIHEWFEEFNSMEQETSTWEDLQAFDAEQTPEVREHFEDLADQVPELEETVATSLEFVDYLSDVIQTANSFEEGSELLFADEEKFNEMLDAGLALEAIDDYAMDECIDPAD